MHQRLSLSLLLTPGMMRRGKIRKIYSPTQLPCQSGILFVEGRVEGLLRKDV